MTAARSWASPNIAVAACERVRVKTPRKGGETYRDAGRSPRGTLLASNRSFGVQNTVDFERLVGRGVELIDRSPETVHTPKMFWLDWHRQRGTGPPRHNEGLRGG